MSDNESIKQLTKLVSALSNGRVEEVEAASESFASQWPDSEELKELQQEVLSLTRKHLQAKEFILNLSAGNLEVDAPRGNRLIDPFKELQANLRHLVWQTREIVQGDYSQKIDFLGDFSDSFNSLVTTLNEKKQLEEELRESEEKYRLLHESAGVGIGYYTPDGIVISYNKIAASNMNGSPEDFIGKSIHSLFPKDDADFYMDRIKKAVNAEIEQQYEDKVELPKEAKWFQSVFTRIQDYNAKIVGVQIISTDITERKRAEEALKESEAKFRDLFTQMNEGFALHQVIYDANQMAIDYTILDINPAFEKQVGITVEKANGALATQLYGVSPAPYIDIYAQVAKTGKHQSFQTYFTPLDKYFEISVFSPTPGYFATIFIDITDRKLTEKALKENATRLNELNATKDKFFSIIAHDLKSPFNSILGLSNILVEQIQDKSYDAIEEYAGIIQKSSVQAIDLLMNLLEWSRSQTGRMEFSPEYVELVSMVNEVTELLNFSAQQKSITIHTELPRNMVAFVDKAMISTILRNLISNAIKFTQPGGHIVISTEARIDELVISVCDSGVGIKKENITKLFRIDENHSTPGTQKEKGTGLGLILCKEFVEKHGGKIWVESESGKGSKFYFSIPKQ